jgi:excinuclease ABC subunit A
VIAVEHHLGFLAAADWIVDLGPGGGEAGGRLVAEGTPADIAAHPASRTGNYLAEAIAGARDSGDRSGRKSRER